MSNLETQIGKKKLRQVALPGTHDSGSYGISATSGFSNDQSSWVNLGYAGYFLNAAAGGAIMSYIAGWAVAQGQTIAQQLAAGIRYLDLRVEPKDGTPWIVHTLWSVPVSDVLNPVSDFVNQNPKEIVLLDFNHFYDMTPAIHVAFAASIISIFGSKLAPYSLGTDVTVDELWEKGHQVIVFYDDAQTVTDNKQLWSESAISSPWPQTDDLNTLQTDLTNELPNNRETFFVLQGVLTPTGSTVGAGLGSAVFLDNPASLLGLATRVTPAVTSWIQNGWWTKGLNIVIVDWAMVCPSFVATLWAINSGQVLLSL